jgi:acetolactate synthase-1/2/3 large subunit
MRCFNRFEMRFYDRVTGNLATYAKQAKVIQFDSEVDKNVKQKWLF